MKLSRFDIGGEIISILTKGMYPDPRDAVREYIQNAIDAKANNVSIKVRNNTVTITDDGIGMNHDKLRKAVRVGISDKNPTKDVGFMGIGIYSAFHLCNKLEIYSRGSDSIPNKLTMDFGGMKSILREQKELRLKGQIETEKLLDLQALLETYITVTENGEFPSDQLPTIGTRLELLDLVPEFYSQLSDYEKIADYLQEVIPLKFDSKNFTYGSIIEEKIKDICTKRGVSFELINLTLQVNAISNTLYRPYRDVDFNAKIKPQEPYFQEIEKDGVFFGIVWGCLNNVRKVIETKKIAGFILKKQGFSIGKRENLIKYFPRGKTFFDRYIGEVIIVNSELLPNAARNDLEFTELRTIFYNTLTSVAEQFDDKAEEFQEWNKSEEEFAKIKGRLMLLNGEFNVSNNNTDFLLDLLVKATKEKDAIKKRKIIRPENESEAKSILEQAESLLSLIQEKINALVEHKKANKKNSLASKEIARNLSEIELPDVVVTQYENIFELFSDIDIEIKDEKLVQIISIIDEIFISNTSNTRDEYYKALNNLKEEISNRTE